MVKSADAKQPACEPLAIWHPIEPPEPICVKLPVKGDEGVSVDVAVPYTPAAPLEVRILLEAGCEVVARPTNIRLFILLIIGVVAVITASYVPATCAPMVL